MGQGRILDALDLVKADTRTPTLMWATALALDRDEQIEARDALLNHANLAPLGFYGAEEAALDVLSSPQRPTEELYARALAHEYSGRLTEARILWIMYANSGDRARFAGRALAHVNAIDAVVTAKPKTNAPSAPPRLRPRPRPRPHP